MEPITEQEKQDFREFLSTIYGPQANSWNINHYNTSENGYIGNVFQEALGLLTRAKSLLEIEPQQ